MGLDALLTVFLVFLTVAVFVAYAASRLRVPYTIAMVLVGLGVSVLRFGLGQSLTAELGPDLILLLFLPGLLFEASYHIDLTIFRANLRTISVLAIPGVLISTLVVGVLVRLGIGLSWELALLFGVIISATDPVAVVSLFKQLGVDKRLGTIVEGESLFNDGVAIVGYSILIGIAAGTSAFSPTGAIIEFLVTVAGGALLGLIAGFLCAELIKRTENPLINIALTTILAYGTYLLAEDGLNGQISPVIAVVVAGIVLGNYGSQGKHSATSTMTVVTFWEFVVFLINSAVFLLIGLEVNLGLLLDNLGSVLLAIAAVLIARASVVYGLRRPINRRAPGLPMSWSHVMFWGGMRGAVSVALVLSLPRTIAGREGLIALVFGYVLFSVIIQGLSIRPLLSRLGLTHRTEEQEEFQRALAKAAAAQASISTLDRMRDEHLLTGSVADGMKAKYQNWVDEHSQDAVRLMAQDPSLGEANIRYIQQEIVNSQKQSLFRLLRRGILSEEVYSAIIARIDDNMRDASAMDWVLSDDLSDDLEDLIQRGLVSGE